MKATESRSGCNPTHGAVFWATVPLAEGIHKHHLSHSDKFQQGGGTKDIIL